MQSSSFMCFCVIICAMVVFAEVTGVPVYTNENNNLRELLELLNERDSGIEESYGSHKVDRKSGRAPSLRLRFGRRSDPSMLANQGDMLPALY